MSGRSSPELRAPAKRSSHPHAHPPPKRSRPSRPPPAPADEDEGDALISLLEQDLNTRAARSPSYTSSERSDSASPEPPRQADGPPRGRPSVPTDADLIPALHDIPLPLSARDAGGRPPPSLASQAWTRILDRAAAGIGDACYDSSDEEQAELEAKADRAEVLEVEVARVLRCLRARAADIRPPS